MFSAASLSGFLVRWCDGAMDANPMARMPLVRFLVGKVVSTLQMVWELIIIAHTGVPYFVTSWSQPSNLSTCTV